MPTCSVNDCLNEARRCRASLCEKHYYRKRRTGSTDLPERVPISALPCTVDGCANPRKTRAGYCGMHHERTRRHGSPDITYGNGRWTGSRATYDAIHQRLRGERGRASTHQCIDCGKRAAQWSYGHARGPGYRECEVGPYSVDLTDYDPRCVSCHKKFDLAHLGKVITTKKEHAHG